MSRRIPGSERTREGLRDLIEGRLSSQTGRSELVRLATRLIIEEGLESEVRATACYQAPSRAIARDLAEGVVDDFETELPSAAACFMDDFEACIAHLRVPIAHRRATRTTNLLERLFVEERRRLKIIPNAFGEKPVLKLMFGAMIRAAERWRAIKLTDFERRQMAALRKELDHEYEAQSGLAKQPSKGLTADKLSSSS